MEYFFGKVCNSKNCIIGNVLLGILLAGHSRLG